MDKRMKLRVLCLWTLVLASLQPLSAQSGTELLAGLRNRLLGGKAWEIELHILAQRDNKIEFFNDEATLTLQGECYRLEGDYFTFYADSAAVWLLDPTAGEITVSERVDSYDNFLENPLAILQEEALDLFAVSEPVVRTYQGERVQVVLLTSYSVQGEEPWVVEVALGPQADRLRYLNCVRERESYQIQILGLRERAEVAATYFSPAPAQLEEMEVVDLR